MRLARDAAHGRCVPDDVADLRSLLAAGLGLALAGCRPSDPAAGSRGQSDRPGPTATTSTEEEPDTLPPADVSHGEARIGGPAADSATRQIEVVVTIPNADGGLVAHLFADGRIESEIREGIVIPEDAVDESGQARAAEGA